MRTDEEANKKASQLLRAPNTQPRRRGPMGRGA